MLQKEVTTSSECQDLKWNHQRVLAFLLDPQKTYKWLTPRRHWDSAIASSNHTIWVLPRGRFFSVTSTKLPNRGCMIRVSPYTLKKTNNNKKNPQWKASPATVPPPPPTSHASSPDWERPGSTMSEVTQGDNMTGSEVLSKTDGILASSSHQSLRSWLCLGQFYLSSG